MVGGDHGLAALEAADLAQDGVQLLEGLLHRLAGIGFRVALVADPVDPVVIDDDQVVLLDQLGSLLGGGQVEEVFRLNRLGTAIGVGLEDLVAVVGSSGALSVNHGGAIGGIDAQLRTG